MPALWRPACHPGTLVLVGAPHAAPGVARSALQAWLATASPATAGEEQHIAVRTGRNWLRLLLSDSETGPWLTCLATPDQHWRLRSCALGRLHSALDGVELPSRDAIDRPGHYQRQRLDLLLRLLDARRAAPLASKRDLAEAIVYPGRRFDRAISWASSPERRQVHRLLKTAEVLVAGGYRHLLHAIRRQP